MEEMVTENLAQPGARFATEALAAAECKRLNAELGHRGGGYLDYWTEVAQPDGSWTVEYRQEKLSRRERLWRGIRETFLDALWP
jgi:hypothetical protein